MKKLSKILSAGLSLTLCAALVVPSFAASFSELQSAIDTGKSVYNEAGGYKIEASKDDAGAVSVKLHEDVEYSDADKGTDTTVGSIWGDDKREVKTTAGVVIGAGANVTIDLNGNDIDGKGKTGTMIKINEGGELTLTDSAGDGAVTGGGITNDTDAKSAGGVYNQGGTFTMNGGSIEGNKTNVSGNAAGVTNKDGGTFTMNGGSIKDNEAYYQFVHGGVYNGEGSTFTLTDGSIENNTLTRNPYGYPIGTGGVHNEGEFIMEGGAIVGNAGGLSAGAGGVENQGGKFNMSGGTIANNESCGSEGAGGVWNYYSGEFNMSGGTIEGNVSEYHGGVLNGYSGDSGDKEGYNGTFHMSGDAKITGNIGLMQAGGVASRSGTFTMSDNASVTGNVSLEGGGVTIRNQELTMTDNATISDNIGVSGGGVLVHYSTLNMSDNTSIANNNASKSDYMDVFRNLEGEVWEDDLKFLEPRLNVSNETGRGGGVYLIDGTLNMSGNASLQGNKAGYIGDEICASEDSLINVAEGSEWMRDNPEDRQDGAEEKVFMGEALTAAVQDNTVDHTVNDLRSNSYTPETTKIAMTGLKFHKGAEPETPDDPVIDDPTPVPAPTTEIDDVDVPLSGIFTRADAIGYLWEQVGRPDWELSEFPDVPEDHYWAVAIGWAEDMGIALPDEDGNFRPDDPVLRYVEDLEIDPEGEFEEFLNRFAVYAGIELEDGELFYRLGGAANDIVMGEEAQEIFDSFFAKLNAALAQAA